MEDKDAAKSKLFNQFSRKNELQLLQLKSDLELKPDPTLGPRSVYVTKIVRNHP